MCGLHKKIIRVLILIGVISLSGGFHSISYASEIRDETSQGGVSLSQVEEDVLEELELDEMEEIVGGIFPAAKISITDILDCIIRNDFQELNDLIFTYITEQIFYELNYNRSTLIHVLILAIFAALFSNFSNAFGNEQIASVGFYVVYLLLVMVTMQSFKVIVDSIIGNVNDLLRFMTVLYPAYFLSIALATGTSSAVVFYNLALLYIFLVEFLILSLVLPFINTYMVVQVLSYLTMENRLSKLADLIRTLIQWVLKVMVTGVVGLNIVQSLLAPSIDQVQRSVWLRGTEAIPVVGDVMGGTAEVILGTLQLIKNGVGVLGLILCALIICGPLVQMSILTLLYKLIGAIVEPISDKRITGCIGGFGDGCEMLLKVIISVGALFLITIAIITAST